MTDYRQKRKYTQQTIKRQTR